MGKFGHAGWTASLLVLAAIIMLAATANAQEGQFTLKQCVDLALNRNVGVIGAQNRFQQSKYSLLNAWGNALPDISTTANYGYRKSPSVYDNQQGRYVEIPGTKSYSTGLSFSMTLFDGGATWFTIKQSSLLHTSSQNDLRNTIISTAYNVKQAYYTLVQAILLQKVQQDALARSKKQLEVTSSKYELGSASLSEKLKAQVTVASDSATLLQRINDIKNAEFNLNSIMNRDVTLPIVAVDTLTPVVQTLPLDDCLKIALEDNPALKRSKADYDASRAGTWAAKSNWVPHVGASLGWGWTTLESGKWFSYGSDNRGYSFGINISYSLFSGFQKKTAYSTAKLSEMTSRENLDADRNNLVLQVKQAYLSIQTARLQYEASQLGEQSAEEDMKLETERYRLGASSILDLLNAQYSLTAAQYALVQSLYQLNIAVAAMAQAMGRI